MAPLPGARAAESEDRRNAAPARRTHGGWTNPESGNPGPSLVPDDTPYLDTLSPKERELAKRAFAAKIFPLFENALDNVYAKRVRYSRAKFEFVMDAVERYLPRQIAESDDIETADKETVNMVLSGLTRARMGGEFTERRIAGMLAILDAFLNIAAEAMNFLEVDVREAETISEVPELPGGGS